MSNNNNNWQERTAIITGGGRGLGLATAKKLYAEGVTVALLDYSEVALENARTYFGPDLFTYPVDVTDFSRVKEVIEDIFTKTKRIDILINCAGIVGQTNIKAHEIDLNDFDRVMAINLKGSLITFQAVAPYMLEQQYGRVLNVASIAGKEGNAGMLSYSASKAAVIGMTKSQGKEYAETGIIVNAIAPAVIRTEMVAAMPEAQVKYMTDKIPMKRCGLLEEFAALASFVVSAENGFSTGFTFDLTGGRAVY